MQVQTGRLQYFADRWNSITSNRTIQEWIKGYKIPFTDEPTQTTIPMNNNFSQKESNLKFTFLPFGALTAVTLSNNNIVGTFVPISCLHKCVLSYLFLHC